MKTRAVVALAVPAVAAWAILALVATPTAAVNPHDLEEFPNPTITGTLGVHLRHIPDPVCPACN